jgi:hypothetical protein
VGLFTFTGKRSRRACSSAGFLKQYGAIFKLLDERKPGGAGQSGGELHARLEALEEREAEREADRKRPVHIRLVDNRAKEASDV